MIDPGIYTKSATLIQSQLEIQQFELDSQSATLNKSTMYHLISSHINQIFKDESIEPLLKQKLIYQFGFKLGYNLAEQECLGFLKYSIAKNQNKKQKDPKQFVGQMKILNSRIWNILVGSKGKLYAINNENVKGIYYKIEDKEFVLGKSTKKPTNATQKEYRKILTDFCHGFVKGTVEKFDLGGDIVCAEGTEGSIYAELKNLYRKSSTNNFNQYSKSLAKDNNFLK